jgi:DMSO/TMAO reductase YedYZ molybdopterin-dependent catalytic subunit
LIIRQREPENLEFPFPTLDRFLIPTERFYVRNHFATPRLSVEDRPGMPTGPWRLRVEGAVERPLTLSYAEIRKLPSRTAVALLECAGNSRVFLVPRASGLLWELGAVGTAEWTGVPLATILDRAGVRKEAVEVILEGADAGEIRDAPSSPGVIHFARSLPLARARRPEVLLAYGMNGADLTPAHGFPLRAVVPGWYAMASIKWLTRIIVTDRPFQGYFQLLDYSYFERVHGVPTLTTLTELQVKALIARPMLNEVVPAKRMYRVHGAAWTGDSEVARVEVSTDRGKTWEAARLLEKPVAYAWRLWEYNWRTPAGGRQTLMARATDRRGRTQPLTRDPDRRNYMISHVLPIDVEVR